MPQVQIGYTLDLIYNHNAIIEQMNDQHNFLIIKNQNRSVGYTSYQLNYRNRPQLMIHKVYLLPSSQGLGIGKSTFDYLTKIAKQNLQNRITLKVFYKNKNAIAFYHKIGFKKIDTETTAIENGYVILDHVMKKDIL